jgi:hypothetical protein
MPGIFGIIRKRNYSKENNQKLFEGMARRLSHNPFYSSETYLEDWFALGHIGLPFGGEKRIGRDEQRQITAGYSGFIYGWKNVAGQPPGSPCKSTTIIDLYLKNKVDLHERIDGSYNVAIFNSETKEALIFNDRFGHRQLYYYEDSDIFLFSTEMKAFLAYDSFPREINIDAAADFFNYTYPLGDKTFFKSVKLLRGGHRISYSSDSVAVKKYWDYKFEAEPAQTLPEMIEEVHDIYPDIIKKQARDAKDIVIPLSGGLDSRFILSHAVQAGYQPHVFTHGRKDCLDHQIAKMVVKTLGVKNYGFIEIKPSWLIDYCESYVKMSEGMNNTCPSVLLGISAQYKLPPESTAFINGIFGGPTNFGSPYYKLSDITDKLTHEEKLKRLSVSLAGGEIDETLYEVFEPEIKRRFRERFTPSIDEEFSHSLSVSPLFCHQKDVFFIKNRIARHMNQIDCHRYVWHDHFALADDRLVDFFIKLPANLKPSRRFLKEYFLAKLPELAAIPYQATGVNLYRQPSKLKAQIHSYKGKLLYYAERISGGRLRFYDKTRYQHFNQWYRADKKIPKFYEDILLDDKTVRRGYYNKPRLQVMLKKQRRGGSLIFELSSLLAFELFHRYFVDQ